NQDVGWNPGGLVWKTVPLGTTRLLNDAEICRETIGTVGITSTPVIDVATQTMYVVTRTWARGGAPTPAGSTDLAGDNYLHALKLSDGTPRVPPRKIGGTDPRTGMTFDAAVQRNRPGLLLLNGKVYVGFGTFQCDQGVYHGWIFGYAAATLEATAVFCTTRATANQWGAGVWQSGNGLVGTDDGHIYFETGNDIFVPRNNAEKASPPASADLADAFVKLRVIPQWPGLELAGHFQPSNAKRLRDGDRDSNYNPTGTPSHWGDTDLGSGGPVLLPGGRLVGGGKQGRYYVLDPATMRLTQDQTAAEPKLIGEGFQAFKNTFHPAFTEADYGASQSFGPNIHGGPVYWQGPGLVYQMPEKDSLKAYRYDPRAGVLHHENGPVATASVKPGDDGMPGGHSSLSANGNQDGIVWTIRPIQDATANPRAMGQLHAFDGLTLREIWNDPELERFAKFNPPTVADGKVFRPVWAHYNLMDTRPPGQNPAPTVAGQGKVVVYGILDQQRTAAQVEAQRMRLRGGWDPAHRWTIGELRARLGGAGLLARPLGEEITLDDERRGKRQDFVGTISSDRQRVSSRAVVELGRSTFHHPPRNVVEILTSVFWTEETGAHLVLGEIREEYLRQGGPAGRLGYPIASESSSQDPGGRVSSFECGEIVWDPQAGAETRLHDQ
ncbi:LGFP repeat-containing protein, partial [Streptomyces barringtoniae]|uniref:LGFP repeat-containing protein n=1 Tax=Streptomyces barringtoniae TaxID=2892029 RepID=UPI003556E445|nr:hypothetical protein [Streptomyces barringtoniae]